MVVKDVYPVNAVKLNLPEIYAVELRLVETAIAALINKNDVRITDYDCDEIGARSVRIARAAMSRMKLTHR